MPSFRLFNHQKFLTELITSSMIRNNVSNEIDFIIDALWQSFINLANNSIKINLSTLIRSLENLLRHFYGVQVLFSANKASLQVKKRFNNGIIPLPLRFNTFTSTTRFCYDRNCYESLVVNSC